MALFIFRIVYMSVTEHMQCKMIKFISRLILTMLILTHICIVVAAEPGDEVDGEQDTLKVEIVDKPQSCQTSSQRGNVLKVHYTGYLVDGQKFDSRLVSRQYLKYQYTRTQNPSHHRPELHQVQVSASRSCCILTYRCAAMQQSTKHT